MKKIHAIGIIITVVIIISTYLLATDRYGYKDNAFTIGNLEIIKTDFKNNYSNITNIPKEYYTRPEFYYSQDVIDKLKNVPQKATYGYGAYPGEVSYNSSDIKKGQHFDVYTFVHSAPGVITYQGLGLMLISPNDQLFETYIEPSEILLYPANINDAKNDKKKNQNWAYLITMIVIAKEDIPKGKYEFKLDTISPSQEKRYEYYNITQSMTARYVELSPFQPSKFFDFILYVQ